MEEIKKPAIPNFEYSSYFNSIDNNLTFHYNKSDLVWSLTKSVTQSPNNMPLWSAYNSIITDKTEKTRISVLPFLPGTRTDWSNLYSALKICQGINVFVNNEHKTIISMDLQLYNKCMQLKSRKEVNSNFIFRLGELHTVFAFLKVIGKYISNSGLDQLFIETNIYGPTTMLQILNGKHMKRSIEMYTTLYLALFNSLLARLED